MPEPKKIISIICPVYNEEAAIPTLYHRLCLCLQELQERYQFDILFTNNASTDQTLPLLMELAKRDSRIRILTFSRNFGYQPSLLAGIKNAEGDAIAILDADCQDPPEMLSQFVQGWEEGFDLVHGIRKRRTEFFLLQWLRKLFYRATSSIADYAFIIDMGDFSLFSRRVRNAMVANRSTFPFLRADLGFVGFKTKGIPYTRSARRFGKTHYSYLHLLQFAWGGMLSSTTFFLRLAVYLGFPLALINLVFASSMAFGWGKPMLPTLLLLDAAYGCLFLGFISTYLARIHKDGVQRPLYIIDEEKSVGRFSAIHSSGQTSQSLEPLVGEFEKVRSELPC